jgi:hypothetical protein
MRETLRGTDRVGRLGGAEFGVLLANAGATMARATAERIRHAIARLNVDLGDAFVQVTGSLGVASLDPGTRDAATLLSHADAALLQAKESGRNRTVAWEAENGDLRLPGRRVLKRGQIVFNGRMSSVDCTIRRLADDGAGLDVSNTSGLPSRFTLVIKSDGIQKTCRVTAMKERHVEVAFC